VLVPRDGLGALLNKRCSVPVFDRNDPIVQLAERLQPQLYGINAGVVMAALASLLGSMLDHVSETSKIEQPIEIVVLRGGLMDLVLRISDELNTPTRES
jgi:hypothetical protein